VGILQEGNHLQAKGKETKYTDFCVCVTGSCCTAQAGLELKFLLASTSQSAGITGVCHHPTMF
jgi:hypothetical protein